MTYWDKGLPTFGIRCASGGAKTWLIMRDNRRISIGRYPTITVANARAEARRRLAEITLGNLINVSSPFADVLEAYLRHHQAHTKPGSHAETQRLLRRYFEPRFNGKDLDQISKRDVAVVLDALAATPSEARHAFNAIRALFRWAAISGHIEHSPFQNYPATAKPRARSRVLGPPELQIVWNAAECVGYPYGTIVQLLMLTGQRRGEIAGLRRSWIAAETRTITLPPTVTKNNTEHTFPYGPRAHHIISGLKEGDDFLFPARGNPLTSFSGWSKSKRQFDELCTIPAWTLHDLRRTFSTLNASLGTPPHVTEAILNHLTGTRTPIQRIYDRHTYMPEMRAAMDRYEAHLVQLCSPKRILLGD